MHKSFTGIYLKQGGDPADACRYDASYEAFRDRARWAAIIRSEGTTFRGETNLRYVEGNIEQAIASSINRAIDETVNRV